MKRFVGLPMAFLIGAAVLAALPAVVRADQQVPFKGSAELTVTSVQVQPDGSVLVTFVGTGHGTHLGQFTENASVVINGDTFTASVTLTAANGDQVFKRATGTISPTAASGTFTVLGGTGRFANATGTGQVDMVFSNGGANAAQTYEGTIQF
jgi:hypothetical protein